MSEELKPCPCCGETKPLFFYDYPTGAFTVCCGNCGMRGLATGYSKDGAIRTWNALPRALCSVANASDILNSEGTQ